MASPTPTIRNPTCWDALPVSMASPARLSRRANTMANTVSFSIERQRRRSMTSFLTALAERRVAAALRASAVIGLAISLAGCYTQRVAQEVYPDDYRERHPITLKEGERTVEIF